MDFERIYALHKFFSNRRYPVPLNDILNEFEFSKNTFNIARNYLCDVLGAPLKNRKGEGYFYDLKSGETYELPGLWFSAKEIVSLALLEQLSETLQPEVVKQLLHPVSKRLHQLLAKQHISQHDWQHRIKVATQWQRLCEPDHFINVSHALLTRQQLEIDYWQWQTDSTETRIISPQRLVYYRDNWYLDAWCHKRQALRTFSVDAICRSKQIANTAEDIDSEQLNAHVTPGYGIFAGQVQGIAQLKFSKAISKRVSRENWHPDQQSHWTDLGEYQLSVPYSDTRELTRDILRFGSDIEVLSPESLREQVKQELEKTLKKYF
ncbi:helix-turn-helix transcriptional regulator [Methylophaga nitratireducenticrescens]|uniref:Transcriptional regulator n=1 Tax=Methylophaga nitratireducenticrescens TaxID=754476 RepID=I1XLY5_METNJ|nr:WYL domain-containing protein [Methylophaga nitratireducenticrescens]AFI85404.1 WYL domain-containing protein [Methylophaga nitratireducenticrescens]AUZ85164.1 WYL domain-containing protein [Methylophaga nitratireducenticrescens]